MRKAALTPTQSDTRMPPVYRLWRLCENNNKLWWRGGMAAQPKLLMMEFEACRRAWEGLQSYVGDIHKTIAEQDKLLKELQRGNPGLAR